MSEYSNDKSIETLVDNILIKVADDIKSSRDKYLDLVMQDGFDGSYQGGNVNPNSNYGGSKPGYSGESHETGAWNNKSNGASHQKKNVGKKVLITVLALIGILTLIIGSIIVLFSVYKPAYVSENDPNPALIVLPTDDEAEVSLAYMDFWMERTTTEGDSSVFYNIAIKNTGNRAICQPSVELEFLDENGGKVEEYSSWISTVLLPGQVGTITGFFDGDKCFDVKMSSVAEGSYDGLWKYGRIYVDYVPELLNVEEGIEKGKGDVPLYGRSEISYIDGPIDNSINSENIGLALEDIRVEHHPYGDDVYVDVTNNTGEEIESVWLELCILDENGNMMVSPVGINSKPEYDSIYPGETVTLTSPGGDGSIAYYTVCYWQYDTKGGGGAASYLEEIPQAVGNMK